MCIYQVHADGGQYEGSYDYIVGTYLNEEDAEKHKAYLLSKQEKLTEQKKICYECISICENEVSGYEDEIDECYRIKKISVLTSFITPISNEVRRC